MGDADEEEKGGGVTLTQQAFTRYYSSITNN